MTPDDIGLHTDISPSAWRAGAEVEANLEGQTREWIEAVIGEKLGERTLQEELKDGVALCNLMNKLKPGSAIKPIASPSKGTLQRRHSVRDSVQATEHVTSYLTACKGLGVRPFEMFMTDDLFENKNMHAVLINLQSVGRIAQSLPDYSGPAFGAKVSTPNHRHFTEAQLQQARAAPTLINQGSRLHLPSSSSADAADDTAPPPYSSAVTPIAEAEEAPATAPAEAPPSEAPAPEETAPAEAASVEAMPAEAPAPADEAALAPTILPEFAFQPSAEAAPPAEAPAPAEPPAPAPDNVTDDVTDDADDPNGGGIANDGSPPRVAASWVRAQEEEVAAADAGANVGGPDLKPVVLNEKGQPPTSRVALCVAALKMLSGPIVGVTFMMMKSGDQDQQQWQMLGILVWTVIWWVIEALPLGITALLPAVLMPIVGILNSDDVAGQYMNDTTLLMIGCLFLGHAVTMSGGDRRLILFIMSKANGSVRGMVATMMLICWFMSWWMSNTATSAMMMPLAKQLITSIDEAGTRHRRASLAPLPDGVEPQERAAVDDGSSRKAHSSIWSSICAFDNPRRKSILGFVLPLAVAYSSTLGGMATLTGSGSNVIFGRVNPDVGWAKWLGFAFPISVISLLLLIFFVFTALKLKLEPHMLVVPQSVVDSFAKERAALPPLSQQEYCVGLILFLTVCAWVLRNGFGDFEGWVPLSYVDEDGKMVSAGPGTVGIISALALFSLPTNYGGYFGGKGGREYLGSKQRLLMPRAIQEISWTIPLLVGGGFALAEGMRVTGLTNTFADQVSKWCDGLSLATAQLVLILASAFMTEFMNGSTAMIIMLPIFDIVATSLAVDPLALQLPGTIAGSLAFALPTAAPANAIAYDTGFFDITEMASVGICFNFIFGILAWALCMGLGPAVFGY